MSLSTAESTVSSLPEEQPKTEEKPVKIYIGTPCYGGQCFAGYVASLLQTQAYLKTLNPPMHLETCFLTNESLITRGRNTIVAKFLNDESFTHLLFIDADISWHPLTVEKLIKADKDIVGAIYPKKGYTWKNLSKVLPSMAEGVDANGQVKFKEIDAKMEAFVKANLMNYTMNYSTNRQVRNNLLEVKHIGTGFMCIKREVFLRMIEKFQDLKYDDDINILSDSENKFLYSLFDCDIAMGSDNKLHYLSEDYLFCKRWIDMGGEIFAEVTSPLTHTGTHSFQGHYLASLRFESNTGATSILDTPLIRPASPSVSPVQTSTPSATAQETTQEETQQRAVPVQQPSQPAKQPTQQQSSPIVQAATQATQGVGAQSGAQKGIQMLSPKDVGQIKML